MNSRPKEGISQRSRTSSGRSEPSISRSSRPQGSRPAAGHTQGSRSGSPRPAGTRPQGGRTGGSRPSGTRSSGTRPQGTRPQGSRPSGYRSSGSRRRRKNKVQPRFFILLAVLLAVIVAFIIINPFGGSGSPSNNNPNGTPMATPTAAPNDGVAGNVTIGTDTEDVPVIQEAASDSAGLSAQLDDSDSEVSALSESDRIQVSSTDLSINPNLPSEWINILLLGTDERIPNDAARTDAMIICSINKNTGEVKLISIARDTQITITGTEKYDGNYRINALNFFGGPNYVMKYLNEKLNLNIQYYVTVNFFGFQQIAEQLGGIDVDITEAEMNEINTKQHNQAAAAYYAGVDESNLPNVNLETYGPNTHLNGRQTLAYARVRYVDSDFSRMERQRTVLIKLMQKLHGKSPAEIISLGTTLLPYVTTNIDMNLIFEIANVVLNSSITDVKTTRIPVNGTFTEERRNDKAMLWDTDWSANATEVYNIIYT